LPLPKDNDVIRGLGFVALYAAYLEEQIDNLLFMLEPVEPFPENEQRWPTSQKIDKAKRLIADLSLEYRDALLGDLDGCKELLKRRNEVIHGRIYANFDRPDTLKSGRANVPDRVVEAAELYDLAENLGESRAAVLRPMILQIPKLLQGGK
jgi:hypothetical protein